MPTLIEVTQNDIDTANDRLLTGNWDDVELMDRCPVALAATRAFGTPMRVHEPRRPSNPEPGERFDYLSLHFKRRGWDNSGDIRLDIETTRRIRLWDDDQFMSPFEFEVNA